MKTKSAIDRDGFPPCVWTLDEFFAHCKETFCHRDFRVVAFKVRCCSTGGTVTTRRGEMRGIRANTVQKAAVEKALKQAKAKRYPAL